MAPKTGFDNEKYLTEQSAEILRRVEQFETGFTLSSGASFSMTIMLPAFFRDMIRMSR